MRQDEFRQKLIDSAIHVIAEEGLDKASTKQISRTAAVNEAYIYRCFTDKEDMFAKAFDSLDEELLAVTMEHIDLMYKPEIEFVSRCRQYFYTVWSFLLSGRDKCLAYVRYFYSPYFAKRSAEGHKKRFLPLLAKLSVAFKEEADVWMILNYILNVMLDFAVKVHYRQMPEGDNYSEHVFRVIYVSVKQYLSFSVGSDFLV